MTMQEFPLNYLNMFNKAAPLCDKIQLKMAQDQPMIVEFKIEDFGKLQYLLAPKVQDIENDSMM